MSEINYECYKIKPVKRGSFEYNACDALTHKRGANNKGEKVFQRIYSIYKIENKVWAFSEVCDAFGGIHNEKIHLQTLIPYRK